MKITVNGVNYKIGSIKLRDLYVIQEKQWYEGKNANVGIVSMLSSCPEDDLRALPTGEFANIWSEVEKLFDVTDPAPLLEVELKGIKYGMTDLNQLTVGEFADAELITHDPKADYKTHELLAILYRPITGVYKGKNTIEPYDSYRCKLRADDFLDFELNHIRGATSFFLSSLDQSTQTILNSLKSKIAENEEGTMPEIVKVQKQLLKLLEPGVISSTYAQETILSDLNKQLSSAYEQLSTTLLEEKMPPKKQNWSMKKLWQKSKTESK